MKPIKDIVISRGKKAKMGPVHTRDITLGDLWGCFFPRRGDEYGYLGYAFYYVDANKQPANIGERLLRDFFQQVDQRVRPKWCPRFVLRLLDLYGNDKSIVRMRSMRLSNWYSRLTGGVRIRDTKWKYETYRIYGSFTREIDELAEQTCRRIEAAYHDVEAEW